MKISYKILFIIFISCHISITGLDINRFNSKLTLFTQLISLTNYDVFETEPHKSWVFITPDNGYEFYNSSEKRSYTKQVTYKFAARLRVKYLHSKNQDVLNRYYFEELIREHSITMEIPFYMIDRIEIETKNGDNFTIRFDSDSTYSIYAMKNENEIELLREIAMPSSYK